MKRFVISALVFALLSMATIAISVFVLPDRQMAGSMLGMEKAKLERLRTTGEGRIILIGGSNIGHGFDSGVLAQATGKTVVNMGLHAGLGLVYHLKSVQDSLKPGDLAVILPEYDMFDGESLYGGDELLAMVTAIVPEHRKLLTFRHWLHLAGSIPGYGARKFKRFKKLFKKPRPCQDYNEYGDNQEWRTTEAATRKFHATTRRGPEAWRGDDALEAINGFKSVAESVGATMVVMPPVFADTAYGNWEGYIREIESRLERNGTPFAVPPGRYRLDDALFLDTDYHLNREGVTERMVRLVEDIAKWR